MGKRIIKKLKDVEQQEHANEEEIGAVKEMLNGANKNFDNNNDYC